MDPVVAGVDFSTTATKVEIRELDSGRVVGRGSSPHPPTQPPRSEQEPAAWRQAGEPAVAGLSVAGQQHGMPRMARANLPADIAAAS